MRDHTPTSEGDSLTAIRENREALESLAKTDLPAATWAERLLSLLDDSDDEYGGNVS